MNKKQRSKRKTKLCRLYLVPTKYSPARRKELREFEQTLLRGSKDYEKIKQELP